MQFDHNGNILELLTDDIEDESFIVIDDDEDNEGDDDVDFDIVL